VNAPAAIRSPPGITAKAYATPFNPVPKADHVEPFHRAIELHGVPLALVNDPPATRSPLGSVASDHTALLSPTGAPVATHDPVGHDCARACVVATPTTTAKAAANHE
jgi:hypothetical protein